MRLSDIHGTLTAGLQPDKSLLLTTGLFDEMAATLGYLELSRLALTEASVSALAGGKVTVRGTASLLGLTDIGLEIVVAGDADVTVTVTIVLPTHWHVQDSFPKLPPSFKSDAAHAGFASLQGSLLLDFELTSAQLIIQSSAAGGKQAGINLQAKTSLPASQDYLKGLLKVPNEVDIAGSFVLREQGVPDFDLVIAGFGGGLTVGSFTVKDVALHLRNQRGGDPDDADLTVLTCAGKVEIGSSDPVVLDVAAAYQGDNGVFRFEGAAEGDSLTIARGIAALVEFAGGKASEFTLPKPLDKIGSFALRSLGAEVDTRNKVVRWLRISVGSSETWKLVPDVSVGDLYFNWLVLAPFESTRAMSVVVGGTLGFGSKDPIHFDVEGSKDESYTLDGQLRAGETINLTALVEKALSLQADLPTFEVDELEIQASTSGDFKLDGGITSDWSLQIGSQSLALEKVSFDLARSGSDKTGFIYSEIGLAKSRLYVRASIQPAQAAGQGDGAAKTGLLFEGGTLPASPPLSLTDLVEGLLELFGASLPSAVPDITLKNLDVKFDTVTKEFDFKGETDVEIEVPFIAKGNKQIHAAANLISRVDSGSGKRVLSGYMEGDLTIGSSVFTLQYTLGQNTHVFQASWASTAKTNRLGIDTLLGALGVDHLISVPADLDLKLKTVYLEYQAERETIKFVAESDSYGTAFLIASKLPLGTEDSQGATTPEGEWAVVFGLEFTGATKLSKIPVLGKGLGAADIFTFREIGLLVASADFKDIEIPQLPPLASLTKGQAPQGGDGDGPGNGPVPVKPVAPDTTLKLTKGVSFVGVIDMAGSQQTGEVAALRGIVTQAELVITASYNPSQKTFVLEAMLEGSVDIPTGGSSDLKIGDAALAFKFADGITFELSGDLMLHFNERSFDVRPAIDISAEAAVFRVGLVLDPAWTGAMGIPGLALDEADFLLGVNFVPPGLDIGLEGKMHVGKQPKSSDSFAFVLEMIEEVPDPLLLSFYVAELDVKTAMETFAPDADGASLPDFVNEIKVTELSFYWAEEPVTMPDGTVALPGLRFSGNVQIISFKAHAALAIDQASGIQGDLELSPIHVAHILDVTGHGKGVYLNEKDGAPVRESVLPKDSTGVTRTEVVPPGGAVLQFRTQQSPYLFVSLIVTLLDLEHEEVEGLVTDKGFTFKLIYQLSDVVKAELDVTLGDGHFHLYSQFGIHLKADIGPIKILGIDFGTIHLDAGFDLELEIEASAELFSLSVWGDFEFEGATLTMPKLTLSVAPASLTELPKLIIEHIGEEAEEIFKDLFDEAGKLIEEAGKEIAHLGEEAAQEVGKLGKEAVEEAGKIVDEAEQAIASGVKEAEQEVKKVEQEAAQIATKAAQEVEQIGEEAVQEVEKIGKQIGHVIDQAAHEVAAIAEEIAQEAEAVANEVKRLAEDAVEEVKAIAAAVEKEVAKILADAQRVVDSIINAANQVVHALEQEAERLWSAVKDLAKKAEEAVEAAAHAVASVAKKAWHAISKY